MMPAKLLHYFILVKFIYKNKTSANGLDVNEFFVYDLI